MSVEMDAVTARQLSTDMRDLTVSLAEVKRDMSRLSQFEPLLQSQVHGLTDCVNRVTRIEDWRSRIEKQVETDKSEWARQLKAETEARIAAEKEAAYRADKEKETDVLRAATAKKEQDDRITANRWLIGMTLTALGSVIALLSYLSQHVSFK
ncbi:MAG: hypothetical protein H7Y38_01045 [Armatimonadetes bacterium]|nr:hypothetical protein [Armatimonadota bacterium]